MAETTTSSGLTYEDLTEGTGPAAAAGQTVGSNNGQKNPKKTIPF